MSDKQRQTNDDSENKIVADLTGLPDYIANAIIEFIDKIRAGLKPVVNDSPVKTN